MKTKKTIVRLLGATVWILSCSRCRAFVPSLNLHSSMRVAGQAGGHSTLMSSMDENIIDAMPSDVSGEAENEATFDPAATRLRDDLLQAIFTGMGVGYIPKSSEDKSNIENLVTELEEFGQGRDVQFPRDLSKVDGRWKLLFTTNLLGLGNLSPLTLDEVFQVIDVSAGTVKNIVYGTMSPPLFAETWGRLGQRVASIAEAVEKRVSFPVDFRIDHTFDVSSQSKPAQLELVVTEFKLLNVEDEGKRSLALPALKPLSKAGAGRFETTYVDNDVRISRGRFGELRIFQKEY